MPLYAFFHVKYACIQKITSKQDITDHLPQYIYKTNIKNIKNPPKKPKYPQASSTNSPSNPHPHNTITLKIKRERNNQYLFI